MTEAEWVATKRPLDILREYPAVWSGRKARLIGCYCLRRVWHLLGDEETRRFVDEVEKNAEADPNRFADDFPSTFDRYRAAARGLGKFGDYWALRAVLSDPPDSLMRLIQIHSSAFARSALLAAGLDPWSDACEKQRDEAEAEEKAWQCNLLREVLGNPFRPVAFPPDLRTSTALAIARGMYESRDFSAMPILADALQDAGSECDDVLSHCRGPGPHVRGCWVVDLALGKA